MKNSIIRGVMLGSSFGVFAALFGYIDGVGHGFWIGTLGGALAGWTIGRKKRKARRGCGGLCFYL
jgi:hypothetical protein